MCPTIHRTARSIRLALLCAGLAACAPLQEPSREQPASSAHWRDLTNACLLDPLAPRAWELLAAELRAMGEDARAQQMMRQAASLREHDLRADFAAAGGQTDVAALGQAMAAAQPGWAQSQIHVGVDGMMELRRIPASTGTRMAHLEISNGNGVTGMARALARRIDEPGVRVTRLSNQPGFAVTRTRIDYEAAYVDAARRLAQRLGRVQLRQVERSAPANLRLVLGRDLALSGSVRASKRIAAAAG